MIDYLQNPISYIETLDYYEDKVLRESYGWESVLYTLVHIKWYNLLL